MSTATINVRTDSELRTKTQKGLTVKQLKLGGWKGKISMSENFNEPTDEFEEYM